MDTSYYNHAYRYYYCNDCANFVSQAIHAGGLATDSTWHPYTYAWINVNGILQYLSETGHITYTTYPSAGDIASYRNYAHVAIITGYTGGYIYFDAHTSDRYHMPSPISLWYTYRLH